MRMEAYYYGFDKTWNEAIDKILSAVACAGKAFHNTSDWNDECSWQPEPHVGDSPIDWIQNAANEAAKTLSATTAADEKE
jgi:hypothetical protein